MSWEDEEFSPVIKVDVPVEQEVDLTLSEKPPPAAAPATVQVMKQKHLDRELQKKHEEEAARDRRAAQEARRAVEADPAAEKRRQEAEQLRSDQEMAQAALGAASGKRLLGTDVASLLGALTLTEGAHFEALGKLAAQKAHAVRGALARCPLPPPPPHENTPTHPPPPPNASLAVRQAQNDAGHGVLQGRVQRGGRGHELGTAARG
jgi:hypothetical protein